MGIACSRTESSQDDALLAAIRDGDEAMVREVRIGALQLSASIFALI